MKKSLQAIRIKFRNLRLRAKSWERMYVHDPIRAIPELQPLITEQMQRRHGLFALAAQEIARSLTLAVHYVTHAGVAGDIAEFGTLSGTTACVLSAAMASFSHPGKLHLFDSFEGMPDSEGHPIDGKTPLVIEGLWSKGKLKGLSESQLRRVCEENLPKERIITYKGWFSDTLKAVPRDAKFSLVHLDCDLYQSTRDVLDHLFEHDHLSAGAMLCFDDWNCTRADPSFGQRRAWIDGLARAKRKVEWETVGHYSWGGFKLIVH